MTREGGDGFSAEWMFAYLPDKGAFSIRLFRTNDLLTDAGDYVIYRKANNSNDQLWYALPK